MRDPNRKVIFMLWTVVAVLIIGGGIVGFMLVHKADDLSQTNDSLSGDVTSLRQQLREAQTSPTPSPTATPAATASPSPSASVVPTPTPTPTPAKTSGPLK